MIVNVTINNNELKSKNNNTVNNTGHDFNSSKKRTIQKKVGKLSVLQKNLDLLNLLILLGWKLIQPARNFVRTLKMCRYDKISILKLFHMRNKCTVRFCSIRGSSPIFLTKYWSLVKNFGGNHEVVARSFKIREKQIARNQNLKTLL